MTLHEHLSIPRVPPGAYPTYPSRQSLHIHIPPLPLEMYRHHQHHHQQHSHSEHDVNVHPPSRQVMRAPGEISMSESDMDMDGEGDEREELTTKGRKRKRLAKACSACHKNKRRCDGFAPCSNCEFSSRPCLYLNAQGETIPPPRTRHSSGAPNHMRRGCRDDDRLPQTYGVEKLMGEEMDRQSSGQGVMYRDPIDAVERDVSLSSELIDIFLKRVLPYGAMFHPPTFYHRLFLDRVSPLLLDIIYALSSRFSEDPGLLSTLPADTSVHARGEVFAERAHHCARHMVEQRAGWSEEEKRLDRGTWEETEFAQALCLLSVYFMHLRGSSGNGASVGSFYLDEGINVLRPTSSATLSPPASHLGLSIVEYLTLMEARYRTFWMLVAQDLCASADGHGRKRRVSEHEMYNIPLPGGEAHWVRSGGAAMGGRETRRRDGMAVGTGNWMGEEGQIGEFGQVLRILSVFSDIMSAHGTSSDRSNPAQHEQALKSWALGLPRHLRFDETNLSLAMTKLSSPLPATSMSGWMYAYMHAIAESAMFYLQAGSTNSGCGSTAQRQSQAVENIGVILEALGPRGRESPLGVSSLRPSKEIPADRGVVAVVLPLTVLANWQDQLRTSTPTTLDDRLTLWWTEITHSVGISRSNTTHTSRHLTSPTALTRTSPTARFPPPSSLGLYATSPPQPGLESAVSTSSSTTLPTPTYRILPPLPRPRASSSSVVYPSPRRHRHLPSISMSALGSEVGEKVELPPLEIFRYRPMSTFFDRTPEKGEDRDRYFQDGKDRPVSPFLNRDGGQPVKGEKEKEKEKEKGERNGHSLVGIAALVSAAEEKSREREVDVAE